MSSVSLNGAEQKLVYALNYSHECSHKGALGKVHKFGHDWIVSRENYGSALLNGVTGLIHSLASSIFHTIWSLTAGKCFVDKEPRELAGRCWKQVGKNLLVIIKGIAGIAAPSFGKWVDNKVLPTTPKEKQEKCCQGPGTTSTGGQDQLKAKVVEEEEIEYKNETDDEGVSEEALPEDV